MHPILDPKGVWLERARRAHYGTSYEPERRGQQLLDEYENWLAEAKKEAFENPADPEFMQETWERLLKGFMARFGNMLSARSRCVSVLIAGPSGMPKNAQKMADRAHDVEGEFYKYLSYMEEKLRKAKNGKREPITLEQKFAHYSDRVDRLKEVIEECNRINAALKYIYKGKPKEDFDDEWAYMKAEDFKAKWEHETKDYTIPAGKAHLSISNLKLKLKEAEKILARYSYFMEKSQQGVKPEKEFNGGSLVANYAIDRIQIIFDAKPGPEAIKALKKRGFNWSPTNEAWQRQLTRSAEYDAIEIIKTFYAGTDE